MILHCSFEELSALRGGIDRALRTAARGGGNVAAPPYGAADAELLRPRLAGDLSIETLEEQQVLERALDFTLEYLKDQMDALVLDAFVGAEDAVNAYFDYAHVLTVHARVAELGAEMAAIIELMTGAGPSERTARDISFPD